MAGEGVHYSIPCSSMLEIFHQHLWGTINTETHDSGLPLEPLARISTNSARPAAPRPSTVFNDGHEPHRKLLGAGEEVSSVSLVNTPA